MPHAGFLTWGRANRSSRPNAASEVPAKARRASRLHDRLPTSWGGEHIRSGYARPDHSTRAQFSSAKVAVHHACEPGIRALSRDHDHRLTREHAMKHAQQLVARAIEPLSVAAEFAKNIRRCCPDLRRFLRDVQEPRARRRSRCVRLARTWFTVAICIGRTPRGARGTARDRARREVVVAVPDRARRAIRQRPGDLLAGPTAPALRLAAPGWRARQPPHDRRGRRCPRARRLLLGTRSRRLKRPVHNVE